MFQVWCFFVFESFKKLQEVSNQFYYFIRYVILILLFNVLPIAKYRGGPEKIYGDLDRYAFWKEWHQMWQVKEWKQHALMNQMKGPVLYPLDITKCDRRMMKAINTTISASDQVVIFLLGFVWKERKPKEKWQPQFVLKMKSMKIDYSSFQKEQKVDINFNNFTRSNGTSTQPVTGSGSERKNWILIFFKLKF